MRARRSREMITGADIDAAVVSVLTADCPASFYASDDLLVAAEAILTSTNTAGPLGAAGPTMISKQVSPA